MVYEYTKLIKNLLLKITVRQNITDLNCKRLGKLTAHANNIIKYIGKKKIEKMNNRESCNYQKPRKVFNKHLLNLNTQVLTSPRAAINCPTKH